MPGILDTDSDPAAALHGAARMDGLGTEGAFEVLAAARRLEAAGRHVVHLEIGEPHFATPAHVVEAGVRALRDGETRYGPPAGLPELRAAIAAWMAERGVVAEAEEVVVTPGAKPMLFNALLALVQPGDEVLVPDPGFPIYASVVRFAGGVPVSYALDAERGFSVDLDDLARATSPRARLLILNSPHNPTGGAESLAGLEAIAAHCLEHGLAVISDEVYGWHRYDGGAPSIAALPGMRERTVLVDGFSKTFSMTGWRLGFGVLPGGLAERVTRLVVNSTSCTPAFVQRAGLAALAGPWEPVREMVCELRARRDLLVAGLNRVPGVRCATPAGAFYAFPDVRGLAAALGTDARGVQRALLASHGLACLAGTAFGAGGEGHLRLSFAAPRDALNDALDRLSACAAAARPAA